MIGSLPRYRPRALKRPALAYTRLRRRRAPRPNRAVAAPRTSSTELAIFAHGPAEFPVATARAREPRGRLIALAAALQRWFVERWQWLRPRTVPVAFAALGMVAVMKSADYLAHYQDDAAQPARTVHIVLAPR